MFRLELWQFFRWKAKRVLPAVPLAAWVTFLFWKFISSIFRHPMNSYAPKYFLNVMETPFHYIIVKFTVFYLNIVQFVIGNFFKEYGNTI